MLKVFLKHHIYEKCIKVLFDAIAINFCKLPFNIKIGDKFNVIAVELKEGNPVTYFQHCKVIRCDNKTKLVIHCKNMTHWTGECYRSMPGGVYNPGLTRVRAMA